MPYTENNLHAYMGKQLSNKDLLNNTLRKEKRNEATTISYITNALGLYPISKTMQTTLDWHFSKKNHSSLVHL